MVIKFREITASMAEYHLNFQKMSKVPISMNDLYLLLLLLNHPGGF